MSDIIRNVAPQEQTRGNSLTIVTNVYHDSADEGMHSFEVRYERRLPAENQVYRRFMTLSEDWQQLDIGWVEKCALVCILNMYDGQAYNPMRGPVHDHEHVVEISYTKDPEQSFILHPHEGFYFNPTNAAGLHIRARSGNIRVVVQVIPE